MRLSWCVQYVLVELYWCICSGAYVLVRMYIGVYSMYWCAYTGAYVLSADVLGRL